MTALDELHTLVNTFSEEDAQLLLLALKGDRLAWTLLTAPADDEPETDEERAAVEEAKEDLRAGRVVSWEEVRREFGG